MSGTVVVVGSLNADLVIGLDRMPDPGETVLGRSLERFAGGKGLNQAVAAARLGADVHLVGAVGDDEAGSWLRAVARAETIHDEHLATYPGPSGTALIEVDRDGANRIVVVPGANALVTPEQVHAAIAHVPEPAVVLVQAEIPLEAVAAAVEAGRARGALTMLNPAPVREFPKELVAQLDVIVPNEHEAAILTGMAVDTLVDAGDAACTFNDLGVTYAVITRGAHGSVWSSTAHGSGSMPAFPVHVVDTVSAGDAFCGGLAAGLAAERSFPEALRLASAAGSLATTVVGAVPSLPTLHSVQELLAAH